MKRFLLTLFALAISSPSFAASSTVSALSAATTLDGTELYYCVQSSTDKKCTGNQVEALVLPHPGYVAANWYMAPSFIGTQIGNTAQANTIACAYSYIPKTITISTLAAFVQTAGSSNSQFAMYAGDPATGKPAAQIGKTGNIANNVTTTTINGALLANKQVGPGGTDGGRDIWFCANSNDSTVVFAALSQSLSLGKSDIGDPTLNTLIQGATAFMTHIYCQGAGCNGGSSTFNTWPASLAGSTWNNGGPGTSGLNMPAIMFKVNSVP